MVDKIKFTEVPLTTNPEGTQIIVFEGNVARRADKNSFKGNNGWSPLFSAEKDGIRSVLRVVDWIGGEGTKPVIGKYLASGGFVDAAGDATNFTGLYAPSPIPFVPGTTYATLNFTYLHDNSTWRALADTNVTPSTSSSQWEKLGDFGKTHHHNDLYYVKKDVDDKDAAMTQTAATALSTAVDNINNSINQKLDQASIDARAYALAFGS